MCKLYFKIHTVQRNSSPIDSNTHVKEYQFSLSAGRKCHKHSMLMYIITLYQLRWQSMIQRNLRLFWFLLYFFVVGPENSRQLLNQSDVKLKKKRITNWSPSFSRASSASACFHLESLLASDDVNLCSWLVTSVLRHSIAKGSMTYSSD